MHTKTDVLRVGDIDVTFRQSTEAGASDPWVFVHGLGEDSNSWATQQDAFAPTRATYAVDVRGHGGTTLGVADGTLSQLADDLLGFLEHVGPSACVGFSMGGAIVLAAAARQQQPLVSHAVCVCTSSVVGSRVSQRFQARAAGIHAEGREFARAALIENLTTSVLRRPARWDAELEARLSAIGDGSGYANGALAMASMKADPLTPQLASVRCPVDVFVGENDASCPWRAGEIIVEAVPNGSLHMLPGVGHFVSIEDPDVLTSKLRELDA